MLELVHTVAELLWITGMSRAQPCTGQPRMTIVCNSSAGAQTSRTFLLVDGVAWAKVTDSR